MPLDFRGVIMYNKILRYKMLEDILENILKDTFILNFSVFCAQGKHYSKVVIYMYFSKKHKKL